MPGVRETTQHKHGLVGTARFAKRYPCRAVWTDERIGADNECIGRSFSNLGCLLQSEFFNELLDINIFVRRRWFLIPTMFHCERSLQ